MSDKMPELLAPMMRFEAAVQVIEAGADELYCGVKMPMKDFSLYRGAEHCVSTYEELKAIFVPLIVWAVKYAVIKIGGRKVYDEIGVPAAFGIIAGEMLGIILVSAINIVRYVAFGA